MRLTLIGGVSLTLLACGRAPAPARPTANAPVPAAADAAPPATLSVAAAPRPSSGPPPASTPPRLSANVHLPALLPPGRGCHLLRLFTRVGRSGKTMEGRTVWAGFADGKALRGSHRTGH